MCACLGRNVAGAVPATVLARECSSARRLQRWWRKRTKGKLFYERKHYTEEEPLAFLTLKDIASLHACNFAHTYALCAMGHAPLEHLGGGSSFDEEEEDEGEEEEEEERMTRESRVSE